MINLSQTNKVTEYPNSVMETPELSILVQTFNHENYIRKCLNGILNQKVNFKYEILLGEDNSTDNTRAVCIEYANKFPEKIRLFLHDRKNNIKINGRPSGRFSFLFNWKMSKGNYLALCDGDDCWIDKNHLQTKMDFLRNNTDFIMCYSTINVVNENDSIIETKIGDSMHNGVFNHFDLPIFAQTSTRVFKKVDLTGFASYLYKPGIDMLLLNYMSMYGKFKFFNKITNNYRVHDDGIFSSLSEKDKLYYQISTSITSLEFIDSKLFLRYFSIIFNFLDDLKRYSSFQEFYRELKKFLLVFFDQIQLFTVKQVFRVFMTFLFLLGSKGLQINSVKLKNIKSLNWKHTF